MRYLRWLLLPFSLVYGLVVLVRNWLYDAGTLKATSFDLPVICVGNLDVGGAGKSPMTEYLIGLLHSNHKLATLSRGYGRDTKGFLIADSKSTSQDIGDEPAQFKQKFPYVTVAVCEDRVTGIDQLKSSHDIIILDDAYQHRKVKPGLSVLLFDHTKLFDSRLLLPAGNLREPFSGRWRADIIVISKCPPQMSDEEKTRCYYRVAPDPRQPVFFSTITYQPLRRLSGEPGTINLDADTTVFLLTGIANPRPLLQHLRGVTPHVVHHNYPDHHQFTLKNIAKLAGEFAACGAQKKVIITTEKDAQRLGVHAIAEAVSQLPVWVLPIGVSFVDDTQQNFDHLILQHVRKHTKHH